MTIKVIKWLLSLAKPLRLKILAAICLGVVSNLAVVLIPLLGTVATAAYFTGQPVFYVGVFAGMLVCGLIRGLARYGEQYLNHDVAFSLLAIVRDRLFTVIRKLGPARLSRRTSGDLVTNVISDVEALEVFFAHTISPVAIAVITSVVTVGYMSTLNGVAALVLLGAHLMVGLVFPLMGYNRYQKTGQDIQEGISQLNQAVMENSDGLSDIYQYNLADKQLHAIDQAGTSLNQAYAKRVKQGSDIHFQSEAVIFIVSLVILGQGWHSGLSATNLALSVILSLSSFGPVLALSGLENALLTTFASGKRLYQLVSEKPGVSFLEPAVSLKEEGTEKATKEPVKELIKESVKENVKGSVKESVKKTVTLRFDQVSFAYDRNDTSTIDQLSFALDHQHSIGIGGASGSGKSTLLMLIQRYFDPKQGTISIENKNLVEWPEKNLREFEGVMSQSTFLFEDTLRANIAIGKVGASDQAIEETAQKAELKDWIETLPEGYETKIGPLTRELSDGERQRLGLARLFLQDAPLLLLDEPTSSLDYLNEQLIMATVSKMAKTKTMVIVSHRPSTLRFADRVVTLKDGQFKAI